MQLLAVAEWMITTDICHWITIFPQVYLWERPKDSDKFSLFLLKNSPNGSRPWNSPLCVAGGVKPFLHTDGIPAEFVMLWLIVWRSGLSHRRRAGHWRHPIALEDTSDSLTFVVTREKPRKSGEIIWVIMWRDCLSSRNLTHKRLYLY